MNGISNPGLRRSHPPPPSPGRLTVLLPAVRGHGLDADVVLRAADHEHGPGERLLELGAAGARLDRVQAAAAVAVQAGRWGSQVRSGQVTAQTGGWGSRVRSASQAGHSDGQLMPPDIASGRYSAPQGQFMYESLGGQPLAASVTWCQTAAVGRPLAGQPATPCAARTGLCGPAGGDWAARCVRRGVRAAHTVSGSD